MTTSQLAWGVGGALALAADCDVIVIVDVLSFTTCVSIATSRGARIRPAAPDGPAGVPPRSTSSPSLSPQSFVAIEAGTEAVLPSPNGTAVAAALDGSTVAAASLRNAVAVADWLDRRGGRVGIVAAGERGPDGRWRPSYEDVVGAGAVLALLTGERSPQAEAAVIAFTAARDALAERLLASRSGVELVGMGFGDDVALAAAYDADAVVPVLRDGVFVAD